MSQPAGPSGDDVATEHRPASESRSPAAPRFTPGAMLGDRYRIVALLGSGGMGEVYRADDTRLGQQVALKFLPQDLHRDPQRLARLYSEVRLGRQVSHPNVCRIYDVGEWEGNHFLAMEYVDGEDLASLLRRIGRLPAQKAFDIARGICGGLAAAHGLGIVHRDLKPANIMIDGRGDARITDFGLAAVAEELEARHEIAGTPAYMAPEQLTGGTVTHKTDLYALGLVLYEIFTGRRLFTSTDSASRKSAVKTLSGSAASGELDPVIQRVIARCVEENPDARPSSIHAVIAALPGGDPLQAAVDAGETPSPQMVAAAGEVGDLSASTAWALLIGGIALFALMLVLFDRTALISIVPIPKPPDALTDRAKTIIELAGYTAPPAGSAHFFDIDDDLIAYMRADRSRDFWSVLPHVRSGAFVFHYRQSPESLVTRNRNARVLDDDPPMTVAGMVNVQLGADGRLLKFVSVPPRQSRQSGGPVDWSNFFQQAGGDFVDVRPVQPLWTAPVDTDRKYAWDLAYRNDPKTRIRIEAASYDGKPVWFQVIRPWASPVRSTPPTPIRRVYLALFSILVPVSVLTGIVLARRNLLRGRGDRRTAMRLAIFVLVAAIISFLFGADSAARIDPESSMLNAGGAYSLLKAAEVWLLYVALEPYVRRRWPQILIGWTRLFAGRYRDPMVGRDLLAGITGGAAIMALRLAAIEAPAWFGQPKLPPFVGYVTGRLTATRNLVAWFAEYATWGVFSPLFITMMFLLGYTIFRRRWAAMVFIGAMLVMGAGRPQNGSLYEVAAGVIMSVLFVFVFVRLGLLATAVMVFTHNFMRGVPFTIHPEAWYFGQSVVVLAIFLAAMACGFWLSLGEKRAFGVPALEEA